MFDTVKQTADDVHALVRKFHGTFCADLPYTARRSGRYDAATGDRFGDELDVPNGTYRVTGSDWLLTFRNRHFARAEIATAQNKYGGKDVKTVPPIDPPAPNPGDFHGQKSARQPTSE